jgi:RimJ/RimL family protein N-acetyltransferase
MISAKGRRSSGPDTFNVMSDVTPAIRLEGWSETDLGLLRLINTPEMTEYLGGPVTEEQILDRHQRYLRLDDPDTGQIFTVVLDSGERAGVIGYWERTWQDNLAYETGWSIASAFQGRGIATAAARAITECARAQHRHTYLHALPAVGHPASNAVCRKAGFTLLGEAEVEYPPGTLTRCNDWRLDL